MSYRLNKGKRLFFLPWNHCRLLLLLTMLVVPVLMLSSIEAKATPFDPNLSITGNIEYDTGFSFVDNASQSGTMTATAGTATTATTYGASSSGFLAGSAVGANPLNGVLTDIGDGFGMTGIASSGDTSSADAEFGIGIDLLMNITNNSATDIYQVTIGITYDNFVDADGNDAFVESEFTLDQTPPGTEKFFTDLVSDTLFGDEKNGTDLVTFGASVSDAGFFSFDLTLNPLSVFTLDGAWTAEGGAFDDASSAFLLDDFSAAVTIDGVQNITRPVDPVPEPATMTLFGLGVAGLAAVRRRINSTTSKE